MLIPYLHMLGVTDLYASPLFMARKGSTHGYDVTDPTRLNPELGTEQEFESLVQDLKDHGMGLLLDIVPNHMATSPDNPWWMDVLESGSNSPYAVYFDIDWYPATKAVADKVLLPILGGPYGRVLENQELILELDEHGFCVRYHETRLPVEPTSYASILTHRLETFEQSHGADHPTVRALVDLIDMIQKLPVTTATDPNRVAVIRQEKQTIKNQLWHLYNAHKDIKSFLDENVRIFNGTKGNPNSFDLLNQLLTNQPYRIGFWRVVREIMNYRRFFDINDLVSVRVEDPRVFEATHTLIVKLVKEGKVTGLRADHIDGLYDPLEYFERLQHRIGSPFYVLAEKILIGGETLPAEWPIHGTTGYDFAKAVNGVFLDRRGMQTLDKVYTRFTGTESSFTNVVYHRKKQVMEDLFMGELRTLGYHLDLLADHDRQACDITSKERLQTLVEITACLPVYRTYIRDLEVAPHDRAYIEHAIEAAKRRNPAFGTSAFDFLHGILLLDFPASLSHHARQAWLRFVRRWQQFTGPIMAKGLEDTSLYVYNRLISLNEVGGDPGAETLSVETFHRHNLASRARFPYTMSATSTHDTKRSEDVRARINVLSELPQMWAKHLNRWSRWNRTKKRKVNGKLVPHPNEEILLYQTLLGAWPLRKEEVAECKERVKAYVIKAAREAKVHTSWIDPKPDYEEALVSFTASILKVSNRNTFLTDFLRFHKKIAFYGALNALTQVLLKIASPGVPDFYQGTELWDFSLVDPDNRRPVGFEERTRLLEDLKQRESEGLLPLVSDLLSRWEDGRIKLFVTSKALDFRKNQSELFLEGDYVPVHASGMRKQHLCAFIRKQNGAWVLVAIPRLLTHLVTVSKFPVGRRVWGTGRLVLPRGAPKHWDNIFTGQTVKAASVFGRRVLLLKGVFQHFPVALLSGAST